MMLMFWKEPPVIMFIGPGQGADAAGQADDRSAGEVMEAQACQPAAAPGPVPDDGIDEHTDEDRNQTG